MTAPEWAWPAAVAGVPVDLRGYDVLSRVGSTPNLNEVHLKGEMLTGVLGHAST